MNKGEVCHGYVAAYDDHCDGIIIANTAQRSTGQE